VTSDSAEVIAAQNDYDMRFQRTKQIALSRGASPITVDGDIGSRADRGDYVEGRVGVRPPGSSVSPAAPGGVPTITSQAQYDALPKGASYVDANGKPHKKGGQ
jgi:hypothetical protein